MSNIIYPKEPFKQPDSPTYYKPEEGKIFYDQPEGSLWFTHDPGIFYDDSTDLYYVYSTDGLCKSSKDLVNWNSHGRVIKGPLPDYLDNLKNDSIWAPDIIKYKDEYRMYCSNSSFGTQNSCIFMAVSDNPIGPFTPKKPVFSSSSDMKVNAIDANLIVEEKTGKLFMSYGSFWGGCYILELDIESGLPKDKEIGTCISRRPEFTSASVEGPYIKYNQETGYYYLFVSYGYLSSDYNIRVGRSKDIKGPYIDINGYDMTDTNDEEANIGYMIAAGYQFDNGPSYMGPGHNSVLIDKDNNWFLICHIRKRNFLKVPPSIMHVYKMHYTKDGWPVLNPMVYAGETEADFTTEDIEGTYERIKLLKTLPQGILTSTYMTLHPNNKMSMSSIKGEWRLLDSKTIEISYSSFKEELIVNPAWDHDNSKETITLTGKDNKGICVWGKKR